MSQTPELSLDDHVDGIIVTKRPGETPECVTFVNTIPYSEVACEGGFLIRFAGPQFTHDHPRVLQVLRRLAKRGVGITELVQAPQAAQSQTSEKPVDSVLKEGAKIETAVKPKA